MLLKGKGKGRGCISGIGVDHIKSTKTLNSSDYRGSLVKVDAVWNAYDLALRRS